VDGPVIAHEEQEMAATVARGVLRRPGLVTVLALAVLGACSHGPSVSDPQASATSAAVPAQPTPSRYASMAGVNPCEILTAAEQKDLQVRPGSVARRETFDSCGWLEPSGLALFDISLWRRSASFVTSALSADQPLAGAVHIGQVTQTSVNGRPALQYRRQSPGAPPGACGIFLVVDDASSLQIEWHFGSPCEGDQMHDQWDRAVAAVEAKLPPRG
jgi:hypothetical protein